MRPGFRPNVDSFHTDDPHQLTVVIELPGRRPGEHQRRRRRAGARDQRRPAAAEDRRRRLPADGDRVRPVPAARAAARGRRPRAAPRPSSTAAWSRSRCRSPSRRRVTSGGRVTIEVRARDDATSPSSCPDDTETDEVELPAVLPVLPLKEMVVFPQSMTPLAIGQERSVRLIDDVVAGDRLLALVTAKDSSIETPGWDDIHEIGTVAIVHKMIKVPDGTQRILVGGLQRVRIAERVSDDPYLVAELEAVPDVLVERPEVEALVAQRAGPVRAHHRPRAVPARGAAARRGEHRRPERARAPRRLDDAHDPDRGAPEDPRDGRRRAAAAHDLGDPHPRAGGVRARLEDPVAGAVRDGEGPARVLPAPAAQGDPGRARRGGPRAGRGRRAARAASRRCRCPTTCGRRPTASCRGSSACRRRRPSTA